MPWFTAAVLLTNLFALRGTWGERRVYLASHRLAVV